MVESCFLKFEVLSKGVKLGKEVLTKLGKDLKGPSELRTGFSSGIDMILPGNVWVNAPVNEHFVKDSHLLVDIEFGRYFLRGEARSVEVMISPKPAFYGKKAFDGTPLENIGSVRGDRVSIAISKTCTFWIAEGKRCKFCGIGASSKKELQTKTHRQILEVVNLALNDPIFPARHVYLSCGNQPDYQNAFSEFAAIIQSIKACFDVPIHLNPNPPKEIKYVDLLHDSGLDEISFNLDVFDPKIARRIMPGKFEMRKTYIEMLRYAVRIFGKGNVSSCLVVGLEPVNATIAGVDFLCSLGVVPKLSCFRPIVGSLLAQERPPSSDFLSEVFIRAKEVTNTWKILLGPLCTACQLQSIVLPEASLPCP